jgi:hypothetical protein
MFYSTKQYHLQNLSVLSYYHIIVFCKLENYITGDNTDFSYCQGNSISSLFILIFTLISPKIISSL